MTSSQAPHTPKRALLVIDVQNEYVTGNLLIEYPDVRQSLANIARAMDAAYAAGIPIVVVQHLSPEGSPLFARGSQGAELHPLVAARHRDWLVEKQAASALVGTNLSGWLRARSVDTLSIIGFMTHNCDDATVRHAAHTGWRVELLHDAAGSVPYANSLGTASAEEIHRVFTIVMHTGFAAVVSTDDWLQAVSAGEARAADNVSLSNQRVVTGRRA